MASESIPVIDLFAGPGGLGEGFSALDQTQKTPRFKIRLSIEKDPIAHQSLELRAFFRQFPHGESPEDYYEYLRGALCRASLFKNHPEAASAAAREAWNAELGKVNSVEVRKRIKSELAGNKIGC